MAQTGFTPIQLYFSSTTTNVPLAANLANGELAINITDGKLFYKDNAAAVQVIGWKVVPATAGGTGQTSYAVGDLLYADTTTTLAKLADVATGNALISGGIGVAPSWGKIGLTTHVSGILPVANGGTNASTASITAFNNITGYSASGATGTTTTNLVFSTSPSITTPTLVGDATLSTGNLVIGTSGKGIDFSATPSAGTSELLADYEEGTWTPVLSSASGSFTTVTLGADTSAYYTKIGREVTFQMWFTTDAITVGTASGDVYISLPFTAATLAGAGDHSSASVSISLNFTINHPDSALVRGGEAKMNLIYRTVANGGTSNLQVGSLATGAGSNIVVISGLYIAA
jgi:hypothetical protein